MTLKEVVFLLLEICNSVRFHDLKAYFSGLLEHCSVKIYTVTTLSLSSKIVATFYAHNL